MKTMILTKGLPASGKSTYAKELLKKEPGRWKRVNRDDLRAMLDDSVWSESNEKYVVALQEHVIRTALNAGVNVIVDNTHLVPRTLQKMHDIAASVGDVKVIEKAFNCTVQEALTRNALRQGVARVPDNIITDMAKKAGLDKVYNKLSDKEAYYPPLPEFAAREQDGKLPKAILCDLDGTLALIGNRSPYDATNCDKDDPHWPVIECVLAMYKQGFKIIFMSGREDKYREPTEKFIAQYCQVPDGLSAEGIPECKTVPHELHMRPTGDSRKDSIVKRELFDANVDGKYNVRFVLDDRPQVVRMWRYELGLTVFALTDKEF